MHPVAVTWGSATAGPFSYVCCTVGSCGGHTGECHCWALLLRVLHCASCGERMGERHCWVLTCAVLWVLWRAHGRPPLLGSSLGFLSDMLAVALSFWSTCSQGAFLLRQEEFRLWTATFLRVHLVSRNTFISYSIFYIKVLETFWLCKEMKFL